MMLINFDCWMNHALSTNGQGMFFARPAQAIRLLAHRSLI